MQFTILHRLFTYKTFYKQGSCAALVLLTMEAHNRVFATLSRKVAFGAAAGLALAMVEAPTFLGNVMFMTTGIACALLARQPAMDDTRTVASAV